MEMNSDHFTARAVSLVNHVRFAGNWVLFPRSSSDMVAGFPPSGDSVESQLRFHVSRRQGPAGGNQTGGPKPFSREWVSAPLDVRTPVPAHPAKSYRAPAWIPSPHKATVALVMVLVLMAALIGGSLSPSVIAESTEFVIVNPQTTPSPGEDATPGNVVTDATATPTESAAVGSIAEFPEGELLPDYRILAFYGHPHTPDLGILGQYSKEDLLALLREEAAAYERADPDTPVMPAFEMIASVAQGEPGDDGAYLAQTDEETIREYIQFTQENGILLILDIQVGRTSVADEWKIIKKYMNEPNVHLAIDPEFAMGADQVPLVDIGSVDAEDITFAQEQLSQVVEEEDLPPKVLIVHRFTDGMVTNADELEEVDNVQLVVDTDGFGDPASKVATYQLYARDGGFQFSGIKLFYDQDHPLMQPEEIVNLDPPPNFVMYQ
jgi:hypothetical protein